MNQVLTYNDLKRANFKLIKKKLYHCKARKADLTEIEADIIDGGEGQKYLYIQAHSDWEEGSKTLQFWSNTRNRKERKAIELVLGVVERTQEPARL